MGPLNAGLHPHSCVAQVIMGLAAAGALAAAISAFTTITEAGPSALMPGTWRFYGFLVFAALFALLNWRPRHYRWLWEIVILNKLLLAVTAGGYATGVIGPGEVDGAMAAFVADGVLTAAILTAYVFGRGWRAPPSL